MGPCMGEFQPVTALVTVPYGVGWRTPSTTPLLPVGSSPQMGRLLLPRDQGVFSAGVKKGPSLPMLTIVTRPDMNE
jgi:hypothetical protein